MPRPLRRTRAAASRNPAVELASPEPVVQAAPASVVPSSDIYDLSEREKEKRRRGKMPARDDDIEDFEEELTAGSRLTVGVALGEVSAQDQPTHSQDLVLTGLTNITSPVRPQEDSSDDVASPPEIGRRSGASTRRGRYTDVSGLDLDDSMFGDIDLDDTTMAEDETRTGRHSTETSSLNVAAFRRRPRVSSIVGRDDPPIRPSSRGPNTPGFSHTINFGNFKRRQREPSILGTARKHRSRSRQPFASDDESSNEQEEPRLGRAISKERVNRQGSVAPLATVSRVDSPSRGTRKRKSLEDQGGSARKRTAVEPEEPEEPDDEVEVQCSIEVDDNMGNNGSDSPLSSLPTTPPRAGATPDPNDPALAPPASSDDSPMVRTSWETLAHKNYYHRGRAHKTPELDADGSDMSSPPSLTHSPNYTAPAPKSAPRGRARKRSPEPAQKVTTAELASLLPRRRHKQPNNDPFAISSSAEEEVALDSDGDELSYAHRSTRSKKVAAKPLRKVSNSKTAKGKQPAATSKAATRTYGSKTSDKENDDDEEEDGEGSGEEGDDTIVPVEENSQEMLERMGEELKNAAKKFKEVDKWELAFEEVTEPSSDALA